MAAIRQLDQFSFHHTLETTPGIALVFFSGPACGACRHLKQMFLANAEQFADIHLFEVDAERDLALTREFEVFHLPSLFLFRDGEYHCELKSEAHPAAMHRAMTAALQRPAEEAP